jgi:hypothetical protein
MDEVEMATAAMDTAAPANKSSAPKRSNATRVFGYDLFISFALGPPPRGTHSYASDLARRLRERDFTVFFSEDEAAPGEQLDSTLLKALHRSHNLVVIVNRGTLKEPRWVRTEVEEFRRRQTDHSDQCCRRTAGRDPGRTYAMAAMQRQDLAGRVR